MSLLEKAEKILQKPDNILLSEEELKNVKRVKAEKKKLLTKEKIKENIKNKIKKNKTNMDFDYELTPIKIQENEVEKLFKKKKIKYGNKIEVLDILLSNFKIFKSRYRNFLTFNNLIDFVIKNVKNYIFIDNIYVFSKKYKIMNNVNKKYKELEELILENEQILYIDESIINLKTKFDINKDIFFFKTNIQGNLNIFVFFEVTLEELKINEYFFDILSIFLDNLINYVYNLFKIRNINIEPSVDLIKNTISKINNKKIYKIVILKILNFPSIINKIALDDLQNFFKFLDIFYKSHDLININYKTIIFEIPIIDKFHSDEEYSRLEKNKIESFKNNFKSILKDYEIQTEIEPVFKIKEIYITSFDEAITSLFLSF